MNCNISLLLQAGVADVERSTEAELHDTNLQRPLCWSPRRAEWREAPSRVGKLRKSAMKSDGTAVRTPPHNYKLATYKVVGA